MAESRNEGEDLGGRMKLIESKIESKLFFHKDAMVEYMDMKSVARELSEEKERMEQEHHQKLVTVSKELLEPVQEELDAAKSELLDSKEQIVKVMEELVETKGQLVQKCREMEALRKKIKRSEAIAAVFLKTKGVQTRSMCKRKKLSQACPGNGCLEHDLNAQQSGRRQVMKHPTVGHPASKDDDLEILRDKLIKGFIEIDAGHPVGIKEIGVLNDNPFQPACDEKLPPEEADMTASELNSLWQELLNDKSWNPFHIITVDGNRQVEVINVDDDKLKDLRMTWGEGPYKSITDALVERKEYNVDGPGVFDLWNYKEERKASLGECIDFIFDQVKQLKLIRRKSPRLQRSVC
uniref:Factor of DNA methylation 1-5/IDN2 domain-containing protein n=1 Tax=Leersia perrieri TaxID=77586 RepID=A0A0D9Y0N0_9ORYZ